MHEQLQGYFAFGPITLNQAHDTRSRIIMFLETTGCITVPTLLVLLLLMLLLLLWTGSIQTTTTITTVIPWLRRMWHKQSLDDLHIE